MLFVLVRFAYTPDTRGVGSIEDQTIDFINGQPLQFNLRYQSYICTSVYNQRTSEMHVLCKDTSLMRTVSEVSIVYSCVQINL